MQKNYLQPERWRNMQNGEFLTRRNTIRLLQKECSLPLYLVSLNEAEDKNTWSIFHTINRTWLTVPLLHLSELLESLDREGGEMSFFNGIESRHYASSSMFLPRFHQ